MKIAVSGATGLIGTALRTALEQRGDDVVPLVRRQPQPGEHVVAWDPGRGTIDRAGLEGMDAVIHLAGENVFGRWTAAKKQRIRESRVAGTKLMSETLASLQRRPATLLAASAIGYYGNRGAESLTEASAPGDDFLAQVSRDWEAASRVAARAGGALAMMLPPFRLGLGGWVGSGNQYVSWIALDDIIKAMQHVLDRRDLTGPVNLTAPAPVTNRELAKTLGKVLRRPVLVGVPGFALSLALGSEGADMLQSGQRVLPERLTASEFRFSFTALEPALRHLLAPPERGR